MRYRLLGNSGLRVSEAALGTMTFGEDWGWGAAKDEARKGIRRLPRGRRQFHRHRQHLHQRHQRIVPRRVHGGPPAERGAGHEIHQCLSGHRPERGRQPAQEHDAVCGGQPASGCEPTTSIFTGSTSGIRSRRWKRSCEGSMIWFGQAKCSTRASPMLRPGGSRRRIRWRTCAAGPPSSACRSNTA